MIVSPWLSHDLGVWFLLGVAHMTI
ncbi:unnamed protein product [Spirodela intermedia]|uniref:Uncharacterized protein n=1 Tax=Spirodela intermedia TaxID=51605 RepID=A0ABN7EBJ3_SPIIN|nr:unnamed protein product [Spirodela intermedia]